MANEGGNPNTGIGLHEATLAISNLLGPAMDNQEEAEALSQEEAEERNSGEGSETDYEAEEDDGEEDTDDESADDEDEDPDLYDEDAEEEASEQELSDDTTIKVKIDGKESEVTLAELRNGYSRTADYTRKATALAEQRKALEADTETIRSERALYEELLPKLRQQLEQQAIQEPNWDNLYDEDPIEAARLERHWRKSQEEQTRKLETIKAEEKRLSETKQAEQRQAMQKHIEAERSRIPEVIPEWKDTEVMTREADELRKWAVSQGISETEVNAISQANVLGILRKAMMFDKGTKGVLDAKKPSKKKARTVRPGSSSTQSKSGSAEVKRASQRLAQSGRIDHAAALLDKLI